MYDQRHPVVAQVAALSRGLLVLCVMLALIWPKVSAAAVAFLPGVQSYVICTGDEMVTILVDHQGNPIEQVAADSDPCLSADLPAPLVAAPALWQRIARDYPDPFIKRNILSPAQRVLAHPAPTRAPPVAV